MTFSDTLVLLSVSLLSLARCPAHVDSRILPGLSSNEVLFRTPAQHAAPGFESTDLRALFYESLAWKGKPTRVFAWYGAPTVKTGEKIPAMVLVHGGGSTALSDWVRMWNKRGYAAIAMDTCGSVPRGKDGKWDRHEYSGPPGWGGFNEVDDPPADQWPCHAVAAVILAHSLIRSFPEVDPERTGITGVSWGGFLTCIAAGLDSRFRFAAPVYGCGFLGDNSHWSNMLRDMPEGKGRKWLELWDPSAYLPEARMPMLWVTGTNDFAFPLDSLQKSYRLPKGPRTLSVRVRMPHAHGGPGESPEEIRILADSLLRSESPLVSIATPQLIDGSLRAEYVAQTSVERAELTFTKDYSNWNERNWTTAPLTLETTTSLVTGKLPDDVVAWYVNLFDARGAVVSSEHQVHK